MIQETREKLERERWRLENLQEAHSRFSSAVYRILHEIECKLNDADEAAARMASFAGEEEDGPSS